MKKTLVFVVFLFCQLLSAQNVDGIENFILAAEEDRNMLTKQYFDPLFNSMQISMGEGWVKSAKPHKKLGFDLTFLVSAINIPSNARQYNTDGLTSIDSSRDSSPTIFGSDAEGNYLVDFYPDGSDYSLSTYFAIPDGHEDLLRMDRLLLPNLQFSVGIPLKTELIVRFMPKTQNKGAEIKSFGLGVKHSLSQYFNPPKATPFNLSVLLTASRLEGVYNFGANSELAGENQSIDLQVYNASSGLIASVDFKIMNIYCSISQVISKSSFKINGTYNLAYESSFSEIGEIEYVLSDPISIENDLNFLRKNFGVGFNFPFVNLFLDYSIQNYNSINLGVSIGAR